MKRLIAGNWKMNGLKAAAAELEDLAVKVTEEDSAKNDVVICPPVTLLADFASRQLPSIGLGAQDCHSAESGAHTGCLSAEMLKEAGANWCIVGHSERRADQGESNALVKAKAEASHRAGLIPIVCVGETLEQRDAGQALQIVTSQVNASMPESQGEIVLAYEPVWAIGTGKTATTADIAEIHQALRDLVGPIIRLLYGGSVKPGNAAEILATPNVNGALVGGASLKAEDFYGIVTA